MLLLNKNYASLKSESKNLYELTDADIQRMHSVLLEIYDDIFRVCEKYNLKLIVGGGTALGAVRHKGFIPWDDDMDVSLTRKDYEIFKDIFENELGDKYDLLAPGYKKGSKVFLMRILKKNTTFLNMIDETAPYSNGIYIDITPIDYAPNYKCLQFFKGLLVDSIRFISYSVYWWQYKSRSLREHMMGSDGKDYYKLRMLVGRLFSFLSSEKWFKIFDFLSQGLPSEYVTVSAGRKKYKGEIFPLSVYLPPKETIFEKRKAYIHNDPYTYLRKMYGNYMKIPNVEDREKHLCLRLDFDK